MKIKDSWLCKIPIAHRGLHNSKMPENSIGAFENALKKGYVIELDVHLLRDGKLAVFHDDDLVRMANKNLKLKDLTSQDLKDIYLLKTEYKIPLLDEVLELVDGKVPLLIETKNDTKVGKLETVLYERLKSYKGVFAIQSFNPFSLNWFRKNAPDIWRGQLSGSFNFPDVEVSKIQGFVLKRMWFNFLCKPNFISYEAKCLPSKYVSRCKLPVLGWVVRSEEEQQSLLGKCDNIIFEDFEPKNG